MKKFLLGLSGFLSAVAFYVPGFLFGKELASAAWARVAFFGVLICPICLWAIQWIFAKLFLKRINQTNVADGQRYLLRHREEAEKTSVLKLKQLRRIRVATDIYTAFHWLLAGGIGAAAGALLAVDAAYYSGLFFVLLLYSLWVFVMVYSRIRIYKGITLDKDTVYLTEADYPTIHSLARRAAEANGCRGEIVICLNSDCNASILKDKDRYVLLVGIVLLHVYTEEELYCTFLHEFSHVSDRCLSDLREVRYMDWLETQNIDGIFFRGFLVYYEFQYFIFKYAVSVIRELEADRAMATHGNPRVAVSALLKLWYDVIYHWEQDGRERRSEFETEEMNPRLLLDRIEDFQAAIEERHEDWNAMAKMEIVANNASHPTLKMRMETLGVDRMELVERACSKDYLAEIERALELLSTQMCEEFKKVYPDLRRERYLLPSERLAAWEAEGKLVLAAQYAQVIEDLRILGRQGEAEAICDRAIEELPEESAAFAHYMKGCARLCRYDPAGMQEIYHAIELNANFLEEGLNMIGSFCCYTGRETELREYRSRSVELVQKNLDEDSQAGYLTPKDHLTAESMPDGMLEEILAYIHSVDEDTIENIYLVRKTVNENFFTSVFIIHFYGGSDEMRDRIMHKIFLYLDSYPVDWHFSLFDYFEYRAVKVEKIKGSLVYSKKKNKGETVQ